MGILDPVCVTSYNSRQLYALAFASPSTTPSLTYTVLVRSSTYGQETNNTTLSWNLVSTTPQTYGLSANVTDSTEFKCSVDDDGVFFILAEISPPAKTRYMRGLKYVPRTLHWTDLTSAEVALWAKKSPAVGNGRQPASAIIHIADDLTTLNNNSSLAKASNSSSNLSQESSSRFNLTTGPPQHYTFTKRDATSSNLGTGAIIGIILGALVVLAGMIYCCFFRRRITERNTQKMMDQVNNMHRQEPQGEIAPEVLPDGSIGLTVRPLPTVPMIAQMSPNGVILPVYPPGTHLQHPQQQQLHYMQGQHQPSAAPISMGPSHSSGDFQQQLRLMTHLHPSMVTVVDHDNDGGEEIKGNGQRRPWEPSPFIPPTAPPNFDSPVTVVDSRSVFRVPGYGSEESSGSLSGTNSTTSHSKLTTQRQPQEYTTSTGSSSLSGATLAGTYSNSNSNNSHNNIIGSSSGGSSSGHYGPGAYSSSSTHYNDLDFNQLIPRTVHNPHMSIPNQPYHQHVP